MSGYGGVSSSYRASWTCGAARDGTDARTGQAAAKFCRRRGGNNRRCVGRARYRCGDRACIKAVYHGVLSAYLCCLFYLHLPIDAQAYVGDRNDHQPEYWNHETEFNGSGTGCVVDCANEITTQYAACSLKAMHGRTTCCNAKIQSIRQAVRWCCRLRQYPARHNRPGDSSRH